MLKKREYLGHTVNFKSKKNSYKDKKNKYVPEDEWVIFENTHEPIIDKETFDNVQRIRGGVKRRPDGWGYVHPLTGLVYCPQQECERQEQRCRLCRALNSLPATQGRRIEAYYILGKSKAEIARAENVRESAVRAAIERGLSSMKIFYRKF